MRVLLTLLIAIILLAFPKQALAQGVYRCSFTSGQCIDECEANFMPNCTTNLNGECVDPIENRDCVPSYTCEDDKSINTAFGCIPVEDPNAMFVFFLKWGLGIVGGVAIIMIIIASIQITTSTGDPKRLQGGKELLTAAIAGIMLLIFSLFILRIIGVNILQIPQLGG